MVKTQVDAYPAALDLERTRREFALATRIHGDSDAHYLSLERLGHRVALVMDDFGGLDLVRVFGGRRVPLDQFLDLAPRIADALAEVHAAGLVHSAVKPENILISPVTGEVRICDFGASHETHALQLGHRPDSDRSALSPEHTGRTARRVDRRSDLYGLGSVLFGLLTGEVLFQTTDVLERVHAHVARRPPHPTDRCVDVPRQVGDVVVKLLAKDPDDRYQSAAGLALDLRECGRLLQEAGTVDAFPLGRRDVSPELVIPDRLYGRDFELGLLEEHVEAVASGMTRVVMVHGSAGIGKTALVTRLRSDIVRFGGLFCGGKFDQLHRKPYRAPLQALDQWVEQILARPDANVARWRRHLMTEVGANVALLLDVIPSLRHLVGELDRPPEVAPSERRVRFRTTLRAFVITVASDDAPLVLFLDDLQWSDLGSLDLIEDLALDRRVSNLLIVGAYRDREVGVAHPLREVLRRIEEGLGVQMLSPVPLGIAEVQALVADTLQRDPSEVRPLSGLIHDRTAGSPLFVRQFLAALQRHGLLQFDDKKVCWRWDLAQIRQAGITDNVVDLLVGRIRSVDAVTRDVIRLAACLGDRFEVETLGVAAGRDRTEVMAALQHASEAGILVQVTGTPLVLDPAHTLFRFLHDRIQQAAYALIKPHERGAIHARIGSLLLDRSSGGGIEERSIEIAQHFNIAVQAGEPVDRSVLRSQNLKAGRRARASVAWAEAIRFFQSAREALPDDAWTTAYDDALAIHHELVVCAYLGADYATMDAAAEAVIANGRTLLDKVPVYESRALSLLARNQMIEGMEVAQEVLSLLGVRIPRSPNKLHVVWALATTWWRMRGLTPERVLALPRMEDDESLAAMRIIRSMATASYLTHPDLFPLMMLEMLRLTVTRGLSEHASDALLGYAILVNAVWGDIDGSWGWGQTAHRVVDQLDARSRMSNLHALYNLFIHHWKAPLHETVEPMIEGYHLGLELGDAEYVAVNLVSTCTHRILIGDPIDQIHAQALGFRDVIVAHKQERFIRDIDRTIQYCESLLGWTDAPPHKMTGRWYDPCEARAAREASGDTSAVASLAFHTGQLAYLFGEDATESFDRLEANIAGLLATLFIVPFHMYAALEGIRSAERGSRSRPRVRRQVRRHLRKLSNYHQYAPVNVAHRIALVEAEQARVFGDPMVAMQAYDRAIALAETHRYPHERALAAELAGAFHARAGREGIARTYLADARQGYQVWSCPAKVADLDARFPSLLVGEEAASLPLDEALPVDLDVTAVLRASQMISGELVYDQLLDQLMQILVENAGAERGVLVLRGNGELRIAATVDAGRPTTLPGLDLADGPLSVAMVTYAIRTGRSVVVDDASSSRQWSTDPYLAAVGARSVLCVPIVQAGTASGAVFLENQLTTGAFTAERIEMVTLLASQASISIENTRLAARLRDEAVTRNNLTRFFPPAAVAKIMESDRLELGAIKTEVTAVFSDITGFTRMSSQMDPEEIVELLNAYFPPMADIVFQHEGMLEKYIGDALLAIWGAPFSHPEDVDRALRSAVEMQRQVQRFNQIYSARWGAISIHIGLNTGLVAAGNIGSERYLQYATIGDTTNVASRICSSAQAGEILISQRTLDGLTRRRWAVEALAPIQVRGIEAPLQVYRVLWQQTGLDGQGTDSAP